MSHPERRRRRREMVECLKQGMTIAEVAAKYEVGATTVLNACRESGLPRPRQPRVPREPRQPSIWDEVDWSLRDVDIAKQMGVTRQRVQQIRREGKPSALNHGRTTKSILLERWLREHCEEATQMTLGDIRASVPFSVSLDGLRLACRAQGIQWLGSEKRPLPTKETIGQYVTVNPETGCWEWNGQTHVDGHGVVCTKKGRHLYARRHVYALWFGPPGELKVLNTCMNTCCVNPEHLYSGTSKDVAAARDAKGNLGPLSSEELAAVKARFAEGASVAEVMAETGRGYRTLTMIKTGHSYAHERLPGRQRAEVVQMIAEWGDQPFTIGDIANKLGRTTPGQYNYIATVIADLVRKGTLRRVNPSRRGRGQSTVFQKVQQPQPQLP